MPTHSHKESHPGLDWRLDVSPDRYGIKGSIFLKGFEKRRADLPHERRMKREPGNKPKESKLKCVQRARPPKNGNRVFVEKPGRNAERAETRSEGRMQVGQWCIFPNLKVVDSDVCVEDWRRGAAGGRAGNIGRARGIGKATAVTPTRDDAAPNRLPRIRGGERAIEPLDLLTANSTSPHDPTHPDAPLGMNASAPRGARVSDPHSLSIPAQSISAPDTPAAVLVLRHRAPNLRSGHELEDDS
ncbi:hypothetical protein C8R45DRAFT_1084250 [Mycena sanguinolenta]|nr:hypothetical protein C8R45DRAFT_1084250 [Mycena sanguinolenta]